MCVCFFCIYVFDELIFHVIFYSLFSQFEAESVQEPAEHVHFLDDNEKVIERNGGVGGNGSGDKSLQPQHPNTHTHNQESSTVTIINNNIYLISNIYTLSNTHYY